MSNSTINLGIEPYPGLLVSEASASLHSHLHRAQVSTDISARIEKEIQLTVIIEEHPTREYTR